MRNRNLGWELPAFLTLAVLVWATGLVPSTAFSQLVLVAVIVVTPLMIISLAVRLFMAFTQGTAGPPRRRAN